MSKQDKIKLNIIKLVRLSDHYKRQGRISFAMICMELVEELELVMLRDNKHIN